VGVVSGVLGWAAPEKPWVFRASVMSATACAQASVAPWRIIIAG
jgi:hypothetical protein